MAGWGRGGSGSIGAAGIVAVVFALVALMAPAAQARALRGGGGFGARRRAAAVNTENGCDFIAEPGSALCLLPFPDDYYTRPDSSSPTGRRVDLNTEGMPANAFGVHIDATPYDALRRVQPRRDDPAQDPRDQHRRRRRSATGAFRSTTSGSTGERIAGRRDRRDTGSLADLDRNRLERPRATEGARLEIHPRSTSNRGTATSSPCATSTTRPAPDRSAGRVPLLPR